MSCCCCLWCSTSQSAMLSCSWKLSTFQPPYNSISRTVLPKFGYVIENTTFSTSGASLVKNICPGISLALFNSYRRLHSCRAIQESIYQNQVKSDILNKPSLTIKKLANNADSKDGDEIQSRGKTGHKNKGRIPWNKGRPHTEETRERISRRTKEALKDPKVRKKMSEAPRTMSKRTKAKIRASLTTLWGKRLKWKRAREKFFQSWVESIANAAKIGGRGEQELDWDSYDKLKQEITLLEIQRAAEKAKRREIALIRAERAAQVKAEKKARIAQRRLEREEKAKLRGEAIKKWNRRSKEEKEKLAEFQEVKLKERLMKIHKKKPAINQVSHQDEKPWKKFDLDLSKGDPLQKEISLADQIRFAKNRRALMVKSETNYGLNSALAEQN